MRDERLAKSDPRFGRILAGVGMAPVSTNSGPRMISLSDALWQLGVLVAAFVLFARMIAERVEPED